MTQQKTCTACSDYGSLCPLCQSEKSGAQKTVVSRTESLEAFEEWLLAPYDPETDALWECWQASREYLKQELLSEEMVGAAVTAFEKRYDKNYPRDTNIDYMKAALKSVVEVLCK